MSIWNSTGEPVEALNGDDDAANYRAEGQPTLAIDIAIADGYHDHIRLAVWTVPESTDTPTHLDAVLSPDAARQLYRNLGAALGL